MKTLDGEEKGNERNSFDSLCTLFFVIMYTTWRVTLKYESERLQTVELDVDRHL